MKYMNWRAVLGACLVIASAILYLIHYAIFRDAHHISIYLLGDLAFLPTEVLLVTLVVHHILNEREKRGLLGKLNMVIGAFFSEVGTGLLKYSSDFDVHPDEARKDLVVSKDWSHRRFMTVSKHLRNHDYTIDCKKGNLEELRSFLIAKRNFLLALLENPNLLEHEAFTELLWAVFHLTEELAHRRSFAGLPATDYEHLAGDIKRAHAALSSQWLDYMEHLRDSYPYLFSLAVRTNPLDPNASVEVR